MRAGSGPLVTVPLEEGSSAVVWVDAAGTISRLAALDADALAAAFDTAFGAWWGRSRIVGEVFAHPVATSLALPPAAARVALVGETAHGVPPTGAQGYNMTISIAPLWPTW